jgi:hypothetical protein
MKELKTNKLKLAMVILNSDLPNATKGEMLRCVINNRNFSCGDDLSIFYDKSTNDYTMEYDPALLKVGGEY